ncbi:MAG: glycine/sarcosine/betaine reductase selenoprotein B family protein [bacterium]
MASFSDLSFRHRIFMKTYRYRTFDWSPGTRLKIPIDQAKLALITTAALYLPEQAAFDEKAKGGDYTYREIPRDAVLERLKIGHRSSAFDPTGIQQDRNLAFPLERLKELLEDGIIGGVNKRHFSFMGAITAPGRLVSRSAPEVAKSLLEDHVDIVFLTPV